MIRLSNTGKMPCKSWSLQARETCPGAMITKGKDKGSLVPACRGCYATTGNYRFPKVKAPRVENRNDWMRDDWVDDMVGAISGDPYFRWFDSGDVYHPLLAEKIEQIVSRTPNTRHWLPTRSYKFPRLKKVLDRLNKKCDNIVVRYSSDAVDGTYKKGLHRSTIVPEGTPLNGVHLCPANKQGGKCGPCRACWDNKVEVVAYIAHGKQMEKVINE